MKFYDDYDGTLMTEISLKPLIERLGNGHHILSRKVDYINIHICKDDNCRSKCVEGVPSRKLPYHAEPLPYYYTYKVFPGYWRLITIGEDDNIIHIEGTRWTWREEHKLGECMTLEHSLLEAIYYRNERQKKFWYRVRKWFKEAFPLS